MTIWMIAGLAALTYLSRAAAVVLLPQPTERLQRVYARVPAPLFAGFAAISLVDQTGSTAPSETVVAVAAALAATRTRSLLIILAAGIAGYALASITRTLL